MKCYNHPKEDALAVCKTCGKGVCNNCLITIASNSYCKTCVEAGRVNVPAVEVLPQPSAVPVPTGIPSKPLFIVGGAGAILSGFAVLLTMIFGGLMSTWIFYTGYYYGDYYSRFINIEGVIIGMVLAVGLILAGIGYLGIRRNYGAGIGTAGFALSIVVCIFIFASVAFEIIALGYRPYQYYYSNPWTSIYALSAITTLILFGVMQVLWGTAHIRTRKYTGNSGLAMATGIMLIISGALTMSVIITFAGMILFFISEILATIVFLMSHLPQQGAQTA